MTIIKDVDKAAERYLNIQGYEKRGLCRGFLVFDDEDGTLVFLNIVASDKDFIKSDRLVLIQDFEDAIDQWFSEHPEDDECQIRCDEISVRIIGESRALIRHIINAIN